MRFLDPSSHFAQGTLKLIQDVATHMVDCDMEDMEAAKEPDTAETQYELKPGDKGYTSDIKVVLVNTAAKVDTLVKKLQGYVGCMGFDTEVAGPQLRGRDFVNITHSCLLGISLAFDESLTPDAFATASAT